MDTLETNHTGLIASYIQGRATARLEKLDKESEKSRKKCAADTVKFALLEDKIRDTRASEVSRYKPANWLSDAANRARQISFVSHPLKFTHTDAKGSSFYAVDGPNNGEKGYLTTATLLNPQIDVVGNAAALDVASLLQLNVAGKSLASLIAEGDMSSLSVFAESEAQLEEWRLGFKQALVDKKLCSHTLAKQLYFPVLGGSYHLISPLYSSTLAHALFQRITDSRFSESAKELRKLKRENKFSALSTVDYLNVAVQTFGGTKPQNVSQLNNSRVGKSYLLSCQPPRWKTVATPPAGHKNAFWREFEYRSRKTVKELKEFLIKVFDSDNNKSIRDQRAEFVDELIENLLQYAAEIQNMTVHAGWSAESVLPRSEQLWLDPLRQDSQFQIEREAMAWQPVIADKFASWLNHKLGDDKLVMKDAEYFTWFKLLDRKLARLREDLYFELDQEESAT